MSTASTAQQAREFFTGLQQRIVERIEEVDGTRFRRDQWERAEGGGGLSCVMEEGNVLERGGYPWPAARRPILAAIGRTLVS